MEFKYLICLFFTTCRVSEVLSLTCFLCDLDTTPNCGYPFSSKGVKTTDRTGFCTKLIIDDENISRYCLPDASVSDGDTCLQVSASSSASPYAFKEELCMCNSNLCNAADSTSATGSSIAIIAILLFNHIVYWM